MKKGQISASLIRVAKKLGFDPQGFNLDLSEDLKNGDFTTNIALVNSKKINKSGRELAELIVAELKADAELSNLVEKSEVAGPGFINFYINKREVTAVVLSADINKFGSPNNQRILIEYTDPNTFKVFHVGHLMSNAIGESLSRLIENAGNKVVRICYPSDIGLHIAKAIWAIQKNPNLMPKANAEISTKTKFLGEMYVKGTQAYESDETAKKEIEDLNEKIYQKADDTVIQLFETGRDWSLREFSELYDLLGTKFDHQIFESEMAPEGLKIVKSNKIFEQSDGATVFKGENYGLHTRVFINSHGLPTYESKDVALHFAKFDKYPQTDKSIIVTANEQNEYFKVIKKVLELLDSKNGNKVDHIGHGLLRFATGKMSSRTGNVISAKALIDEIKNLVKEKIKDRGFSETESAEISNIVAVGAIKYTILRSAVGSDIIFDSAASVSFEGDSGPYLQYSAVRAKSVLDKAGVTTHKSFLESIGLSKLKTDSAMSDKAFDLSRLLIRFSDVASRAEIERAPQIVANYLVKLAGEFNSFYAVETIIDSKNPNSEYNLALTRAFYNVMERGLWLLGIKVPAKM